MLQSLSLKCNIENLEWIFLRQFIGLRWLYNLLNSKIDYPDILALINIIYKYSKYNIKIHVYILCLNRILSILANITTVYLTPVNRIFTYLKNKLKNCDFFSFSLGVETLYEK